jgi:26S proteasome regulatory subunit N7
MAEENVLPIPNLALPQECFVLQQLSLSHLHDRARAALLQGIKADQMAPYYRLVVAANVLPLDQALLDKLEKENSAELERLDKLLKEAEETEGESDIADALRAKASYLTRIGEKVHPVLIVVPPPPLNPKLIFAKPFFFRKKRSRLSSLPSKRRLV